MYNDFESSVQVTSKNESLLDSLVSITESNSLDIQYVVPFIIDLIDKLSTASVYHKYDIESLSIIRALGKLDIDSKIGVNVYKDLISKIVIPHISELVSEASIASHSVLDIDSKIGVNVYKDLISKIVIPHISELVSEASIASHSVLDIIFNLLQPPITKLPALTLKDSYIRLNRPTLNYGTAQTLVLGKTIDDEYRCLFEFDISSVYNLADKELAIADIVLKFTALYDSNMKIEMYEISQEWEENSVTWSNFTQELNNLILSFRVMTQTVRINVLPYVQSLMQQGKTKLSIILKFNDLQPDSLFYISSKETPDSLSHPYLDLGARPISWTGYLGNSDLDGEGFIKALKNRDLFSEVSVNNHYNINSRVKIGYTTHKDTDSFAQVFKFLDFDSSATVRTNYSHLNSSVRPRVKGYNDLNGRITARPKFDIDSSVFIKLTKAQDLDSKVIIKQFNDLESFIHILEKYDTDSQVIARLQEAKDLLSQALIQHIITEHTDLDSSVGILESDIKSVELSSNANIFKPDDLNSSAIIYRKQDLDSSVTVIYNNDIDSIADIFKHLDLTSNVTIRGINRKDLDAKADIYKWKEIDSSATARITEFLDLDSISIIKQKDSSDFSSIADIYDLNELESSATPRLTDYVNLESISIIRQKSSNEIHSIADIYNISDLESLVELYEWTQLDSSAIVKQSDLVDLLSSVISRQFDISEIHSIAWSYAYEHSNFDSICYLVGLQIDDRMCHILVMCKKVEDLNSSVTINTDARYWIPNIHGADVFKFEDRKLPRKWIKS